MQIYFYKYFYKYCIYLVCTIVPEEVIDNMWEPVLLTVCGFKLKSQLSSLSAAPLPTEPFCQFTALLQLQGWCGGTVFCLTAFLLITIWPVFSLQYFFFKGNLKKKTEARKMTQRLRALVAENLSSIPSTLVVAYD